MALAGDLNWSLRSSKRQKSEVTFIENFKAQTEELDIAHMIQNIEITKISSKSSIGSCRDRTHSLSIANPMPYQLIY
jgi:hypothetical protein